MRYLSVLYSLLGSKSEIDCRGKILFIEDLDEYLYHSHRNDDKFEAIIALKIKGLIGYGMTDMHDKLNSCKMQWK